MKKIFCFILISGLSNSQGHCQTIAAGHWHSLAICNDGFIRAWGGNDTGQLGDSTQVDRYSPVITHGVSDVVKVATKFRTSLALKSDSTVWQWGSNAAMPTVATQVAGLSGVVAISVGNDHFMALKSDQTVWTWGLNTYGQLGNGSSGGLSLVPIQVTAISGVTAIAAGDQHSLALKSDGTMWGWGNNDYGQLGDSTQVQRNLPVQVHGLANVTGISAALYTSFAIRADSTAWSWGANSSGILGDGSSGTRHVPGQVAILSGVVNIFAGTFHCMAIRSDGTAWAWGDNGSFQLGDGTQTDRYTPIQVQGLSNVQTLAAGTNHSMALLNNGTVWTCGINPHGQLGDSAVFALFTMQQVPNLCSGITTSVELQQNDESGMIVFPNPAKNKIRIKADDIGEEYNIEMYSVAGELFYSRSVKNAEEIYLEQIPSGTYFIKVISASKIRLLKFVVL